MTNNLKNTSINRRYRNCKANVNKLQRADIKLLSEDKSIVIKEAHEGGAIVIMDAEHNKTMAYEILSNNENYELLENDPSKANTISYRKLIEKHTCILTEKEEDYLRRFESKDSNFYGLPKVHKSTQISSECQQSLTYNIQLNTVSDLKLRPIIAGPVCLTHRLSNLIDILLEPLTNRVKSYLRDTIDFLNHLPDAASYDTFLASFDVESLYSNIPHDLGLKAIKFWLEQHPEDLHIHFSKESILESIEFILKNNTFYFNGMYYR